LTGDLPDIKFYWFLKMLRPGSGIYLEALASTNNPYAVIGNPQTSPSDLQTGGELFQSHCSSCHGGEGHSDQKSLFGSNFLHGDGDWASFRNSG
jgi:mono/diheme cytochrome c family protein